MFKQNKTILLFFAVLFTSNFIGVAFVFAQSLTSIKFQINASPPACTQLSQAGTFYFDGTNYKICTGVAGYKNVLNEVTTLTDAQVPDTITISYAASAGSAPASDVYAWAKARSEERRVG